MIDFILLIFVFATMIGGAGAILGLSYHYVSRSHRLGAAAIWFGTIAGFCCGCYFGFNGIGGGAANGLNWFGQPIIAMPLTGLGIVVVAVFCLSFAMRIAGGQQKSQAPNTTFDA